jgi:hypothetical protein
MVQRLVLALVAVWATSTTNLIKDLGLGFLPQALKMKSDRFCKGAIASLYWKTFTMRAINRLCPQKIYIMKQLEMLSVKMAG